MEVSEIIIGGGSGCARERFLPAAIVLRKYALWNRIRLPAAAVVAGEVTC